MENNKRVAEDPIKNSSSAKYSKISGNSSAAKVIFTSEKFLKLPDISKQLIPKNSSEPDPNPIPFQLRMADFQIFEKTQKKFSDLENSHKGIPKLLYWWFWNLPAPAKFIALEDESMLH